MVTLAAPLQAPQLDVEDDTADESTVGWVMVTKATSGHPFASNTVRLVTPAQRPVIVWVVTPPDQKYVNGAVPPVGFEMAEPSHNPEQETLLSTDIFASRTEGAVSVMIWVVEQLLLSVTVIV